MAAGHQGFLGLLDEIRALHVKKAADYGAGSDPLANCRASAELGVAPWIGTMIRALDKVTRIKSFLANGRLENESVEDSLKDLAAYALIALVLFREQGKPAEPERTPELSAADLLNETYPGEAKRRALAAKPLALTDIDRSWIKAEVAARPVERKKVYIAGPISKGDLAHNINQATAAFFELARAGIAPWCPQWSCFSGGVNVAVTTGAMWSTPTTGGGGGLTHEDWLAIDLPWVRAADAVLRLPGVSTGADHECEVAVLAGKPVFHSVAEVVAWAKPA